MVADASIRRLFGSNRKSIEAGGSQWKELQKKLEVSVESMKAFTTLMEAPTASTEGCINLNEENNFRKNIFLRFVKLVQIV